MNIFDVPVLGNPEFKSPLQLSTKYGDKICNFVDESVKLDFDVYSPKRNYKGNFDKKYLDGQFEIAGPREKIYFEPKNTTCAIVTCGGLCPGINNVIRAIVMELHYHYKVSTILGIRYGYAGLNPAYGFEPIELTPEYVLNIQEHGGTCLGSSRGSQDDKVVVKELDRLGVDILICIGGDGTQRGVLDICNELKRQNKKISVIGIPKTIDNDIPFIEKSFGFETASSKAVEAIRCAHVEAVGAYNGIGLVKLMGRHSGYISAYSTLALNDVNFVVIPEVPFDLRGKNGLLENLRRRLEHRHHAVIVVAEGAGQEYFDDNHKKDMSGNKKLEDIGLLLKDEIDIYLKEKGVSHTLKYIDPSYIIRSVAAIPSDVVFCNHFGQYAIHAAMSGRTGMLIGWHKNTFVHIPLEQIVSNKKSIDPESPFWFSVLETTGQSASMINNPREY